MQLGVHDIWPCLLCFAMVTTAMDTYQTGMRIMRCLEKAGEGIPKQDPKERDLFWNSEITNSEITECSRSMQLCSWNVCKRGRVPQPTRNPISNKQWEASNAVGHKEWRLMRYAICDVWCVMCKAITLAVRTFLYIHTSNIFLLQISSNSCPCQKY